MIASNPKHDFRANPVDTGPRPGDGQLRGWSLPLSPAGRASALPPPPWNYSGELIVVDFNAGLEQVAALVPPPLKPTGDGSCSLAFCHWCASADLDPRILADPARSQHTECYLLVHATMDGQHVGRLAYAWVDGELALLRGHLQGFAKKMGAIAMSRAVEVGKGGVQKKPGSRFAAHVSVLGRRVATAAVTIEREESAGFIPPSGDIPFVHTRHFQSLSSAKPAVHEIGISTVVDVETGRVFSGPATLEFGESEFEELADLGRPTTTRGYVFSQALSITGGTSIAIP